MKLMRLAPILVLLAGFVGELQAEETGRGIYLKDAPQRRACVNCHLRDGSGSGEGNTSAQAIDWSILSRERGYGGPADLARMLRTGIAPDGRRIAMPRVVIGDAEAEALTSYLGHLAEEDRRGATGGEIVIGVGQVTPDDPLPILLAKAMIERDFDRAIFGFRIVLRSMTLAEIARLDERSEIFAVVGLPELWPGTAALALSGAGIPNLMPRGFLIGSEGPYDAIGLMPTLSQITTRAEKLPGCVGQELFLRQLSGREMAPLASRLRLKIARSEASADHKMCQLAPLTSGGGVGVPVAVVTIPTQDGARQTLLFEPMAGVGGDGAIALKEFVRILAEQIESAVIAMRGNPGRVRFIRAFRQTNTGRDDPVVTLDWRFPRLGAITRIEFRAIGDVGKVDHKTAQ